jgi:hypothetical protein
MNNLEIAIIIIVVITTALYNNTSRCNNLHKKHIKAHQKKKKMGQHTSLRIRFCLYLLIYIICNKQSYNYSNK